MLVIEKQNFSLHNPSWKFTLGPETYETKDTPRRVERIREALAADGTVRLHHGKAVPGTPARAHPPVPRLHQEDLAAGAARPARRSTRTFSRARAHDSQRKIHPLWGGLWCTDAVTPIMGRTYEVAKGSAEAAMTGAEILLRRPRTRGLRPVPTLRTPRRSARLRRLLLLQQHRDRRRAAGAARHRRHPRHRLSPRQRHPGVLRGAQGRLHVLDPRRSRTTSTRTSGATPRDGARARARAPTSTCRCRSDPETKATSKPSTRRCAPFVVSSPPS